MMWRTNKQEGQEKKQLSGFKGGKKSQQALGFQMCTQHRRVISRLPLISLKTNSNHTLVAKQHQCWLNHSTLKCAASRETGKQWEADWWREPPMRRTGTDPSLSPSEKHIGSATTSGRIGPNVCSNQKRTKLNPHRCYFLKVGSGVFNQDLNKNI